jgi:hypothetical protein
MNYMASITDFFRSPKWVPNLLLGAVCMLIPIVGPLVLVGWMVGPLFRSRDLVNFDRFPDFDFSNFGKQLERGLWPFLVNLVAGFVMVPVIWLAIALPMGLLFAGTAATQPNEHSEVAGAVVVGGVVLMVILIFAAVVALTLILKPIMLRAAITQDFGQAFNFRFIKDFIARTWVEQIVSLLFLMFAGITLGIIGMVAFCLGIYLVVPLMTFAQWHLERQLYDLYLARGGEPVPVSPKLNDGPPTLPPV